MFLNACSNTPIPSGRLPEQTQGFLVNAFARTDRDDFDDAACAQSVDDAKSVVMIPPLPKDGSSAPPASKRTTAKSLPDRSADDVPS